MQLREEHGTFWHRVRSELVQNEIEKSGSATVLDIGAGAGHLGRWLQEKNPSVKYLYDEQLESLKAQLIVRFGEDSLRGPQSSISDVDMVCMLDVIEHIEDDLTFLRLLHTRMREDSLVVATVPAMNILFSSWDVALGHFRRYDKKSLRKALQDSGFEILECSYVFAEMVPLALVRKYFRRKKLESVAEFPNLPRSIDSILWLICRSSSRFRRFWPVGTSLVIVGKRVGQRS